MFLLNDSISHIYNTKIMNIHQKRSKLSRRYRYRHSKARILNVNKLRGLQQTKPAETLVPSPANEMEHINEPSHAPQKNRALKPNTQPTFVSLASQATLWPSGQTNIKPSDMAGADSQCRHSSQGHYYAKYSVNCIKPRARTTTSHAWHHRTRLSNDHTFGQFSKPSWLPAAAAPDRTSVNVGNFGQLSRALSNYSETSSKLRKSSTSVGVWSRLLDDSVSFAQKRKSRIQSIAALGKDRHMWYSEMCPSYTTETDSSIHIGRDGVDLESVVNYATDPILANSGSVCSYETGGNIEIQTKMQRDSGHIKSGNMLDSSHNALESSVLWMHGFDIEHKSDQCMERAAYLQDTSNPQTGSTAQQAQCSPSIQAKAASRVLSDRAYRINRYMFYSTETGAIFGKSLSALTHSDKGIDGLIDAVLEEAYSDNNQSPSDSCGCFWIDIMQANEQELNELGDIFELHPLTIQDIIHGCSRDKIDRFASYTFIAYRAINNKEEMAVANQTGGQPDCGYCHSCLDGSSINNWKCSNMDEETNNRRRFSCAGLLDNAGYEKESKGEAMVFIIMKQNYVLSFHSGGQRHVVERVLQRLSAMQAVAIENEQNKNLDAEPLLRLVEYPPYIVYAMLDEITDQLSPEIADIEQQVDEIDQLVLVLSHGQHEQMLRQMGEQRRWILQTWQVAQAKPAVVAVLIEQLEATVDKRLPAVCAEVKQYLGDIHSHLVAGIDACARAEAVLARSHSNYLAKISLELSRATVDSNSTAERWTMLGTIVVPINIVTSFLGVNLKVPGQDRDDTVNFFVVLACMLLYTFITLAFWRWRQLA